MSGLITAHKQKLLPSENGTGAPADIEMQPKASSFQLCTTINLQTCCFPRFTFPSWTIAPSPHGLLPSVSIFEGHYARIASRVLIAEKHMK